MRDFVARYLDPLDAIVELIYGVLIVMTFTMAVGALDLRLVPEETVMAQMRSLLLAALGCAIAWGLIDAVVYLMTCVAERNHAAKVLRDVQAAETPAEQAEVVADAMEDQLVTITDEAERQEIYANVAQRLQRVEPDPSWIELEDVQGAIAIFLVALVATIPVVLPLLFGSDPFLAMRVSNALSLTILFLAGDWWAKQTGTKPVRTGLVVAALGLFVVTIAIPMGG
ncbi:MAG: VIT1/CCC1 transporter family protein [Caldilineaceae bacterium]